MNSNLPIFLTTVVFALIWGGNDMGNFYCKDNPFRQEIVKFVEKVDSIPRSKEFQNVILVDFFKKNNNLIFTISTAYYYPDEIKDYFLFRGYLVVILNNPGNPYQDWLKFIKKEPIPSEFRSKSEIHMRAFEPWIVKYQIINKDSIRLLSNNRY